MFISPIDFGPRLDEYLASCRRRTSWGRAPSKDDIRQAIASLASPNHPPYTTFETILALETRSSCAHIDLLLTGAHILPSCIRLLKQYCSDRISVSALFDYAYGYLCLQVMNLSIEVAKLAQVNALSLFLHSVERSSGGTQDKAITKDLSIYMRKWESKEFTPQGQHLLPANKLLGWRSDASTGLATALSRIGGFTILDMVFLMLEIWKARGELLGCVKGALQLPGYAGWCGIFHLMHNTLVRMHGISHTNGQEYDEADNWITLITIIQRYALCTNDHEDITISYLLKNRPNNEREKPRTSAVSPADVGQIVEAYINKASQHPTIKYAHATRLFAFTLMNCYLDEYKFVSNFTRISEAALADSWVQLGMMTGVGLSMWTYFTDSVISTLIVVPAFSKVFLEMRPTVLAIFVNENLLDFLGYLVLYPLTTDDKMVIENRWYWQKNMLKILHQFSPQLGEHMQTASLERIDSIYSTWIKTAQSLQYHKVMRSNNSTHAKDYLHTWEDTWDQIGDAHLNRRATYNALGAYLGGIVVADVNRRIGIITLIPIDQNA
ncbi:unnamed protein product [Rhizoctonia solani]|uniref:Uncharacterized protein n=1 Tax=Rhizoctonia solani TaxID=456999 RepID=A0A8H3DIH4_9AGAM|nr:unnamed protein product [Rhizoctonia solani]